MNSPLAESGTTDRSARWLFAAGFWGAAEATLFFIVPDVLTTYRALPRFRDGFFACLAALAGALLGGILLFWFARHSPTAAHDWITAVPGASEALAHTARADFDADEWLALFRGSFTGRPYKLYVLSAADSNASLPLFVAISAVTRLTRFSVSTGCAWILARALRDQLSLPAWRRLLLAAWFIFYVIYFFRLAH